MHNIYVQNQTGEGAAAAPFPIPLSARDISKLRLTGIGIVIIMICVDRKLPHYVEFMNSEFQILNTQVSHPKFTQYLKTRLALDLLI